MASRLNRMTMPVGVHLRRLLPRSAFFLSILSLGLSFPAMGLAENLESSEHLTRWLQAQTNLHTWKADVVQTRRLKTLTQPLTARGRVWFREPNLFRWEIGTPPTTIAVRQSGQMMILYPRLQRAERLALGESASGPWKEILALLEAGFPRGRKDLDDRFEILDRKVADGSCTLRLRPNSPAARRMMPRLEVTFSIADYTLRSTELEFADGSTMRNEFHDVTLNPDLEEALFQPEVPDDYQIVDAQTR